MYTFSSKLRMSAIILMIVGLLGIGYGFISAPKTVEEAKAMVSDSHHDDSASLVAGGHDAHSDRVMTLLMMSTCYTNYKTSHGLPFM